MLEVAIFLSFAFSTLEELECDTECAVNQNLDIRDYSLRVRTASFSSLRRNCGKRSYVIKETAEKKSLDRHITAIALT
jgi:hypothetical protein